MNKYNTFKSGSGSDKYNSFLSNGSKNKEIKPKYDYKDNDFPDLVSSEKPVNTTREHNKKYLEICSVKQKSILAKKNTVPPGWVQYSRPKGVCIPGSTMKRGTTVFDVTYGKKTARQLELEAEDEKEKALLESPSYHYNKMIDTLTENWARYKTQYDEIHGEGSYDLIYYTEPVYPLDEYFSDTESDTGNYDSQEDLEIS